MSWYVSIAIVLVLWILWRSYHVLRQMWHYYRDSPTHLDAASITIKPYEPEKMPDGFREHLDRRAPDFEEIGYSTIGVMIYGSGLRYTACKRFFAKPGAIGIGVIEVTRVRVTDLQERYIVGCGFSTSLVDERYIRTTTVVPMQHAQRESVLCLPHCQDIAALETIHDAQVADCEVRAKPPSDSIEVFAERTHSGFIADREHLRRAGQIVRTPDGSYRYRLGPLLIAYAPHLIPGLSQFFASVSRRRAKARLVELGLAHLWKTETAESA